MTVKDIDELASEKYLQSGEVDARIADLARAGRDDYMDEESWESGEGERKALEEFRDEVSGQVGPARWNNGVTLITDSAWDDFALYEAESLYGRAAVDSGYFRVTEFSDDMRLADYDDCELNGYTFWYRM